MSRIKFRLVDKNRLVKRYPFVRTPARLAMQSDGAKSVAIEIGKLEFNNEDSKSFRFEKKFDSANYNIVAVPRQSTTIDSADVNVFIDNAQSDELQVTIGASAPFTGIVDIFAIQV